VNDEGWYDSMSEFKVRYWIDGGDTEADIDVGMRHIHRAIIPAVQAED